MKIRNYQPSDKATLVLRLTDCQIRKTPANAEYASLIGFDGDDLIDVKIWALTDEIKSQLKNGEIYELSGVMKDYQGKCSLTSRNSVWSGRRSRQEHILRDG